jgi:excinuclease ABC subunit B
MEETARRRELQMRYNEEHGITPHTVEKSVADVRFVTRVADAREEREEAEGRKREGARRARVAEAAAAGYDLSDPAALIARIEADMKEAATALDFEQAARLRDELFELKARFGDVIKGDEKGDRKGARRPGDVADLRAAR